MFKKYMNDYKFLIGSALCTAVILSIIKSKFLNNKCNSNTTRNRRISFNSQALIHGAFPTEAKVSPPIINILYYFKKLPSLQLMKDTMKDLLFFERFRCACTEKPDGSWEFVDVEIELSNHFETIEVNNEEEMMRMIDKINNTDLSSYAKQPLWKFYSIGNKQGNECVLLRLHHVIGDGISLVGVLSNLFTDASGNPAIIDIPIGKASLGSRAKVDLSFYLKVIRSFFQVLGLALSPFDSNILFRHSECKPTLVMSGDRETVIFPTLKLDFIKQIKNSANVTINDVLLGATTGAIKRYCIVKKDPLFDTNSRGYGKVQLRSLLPVAFPGREFNDPIKALRNKWSFVSVDLPINEESSIDRIQSLNKTTASFKSSPIAFIQLWVQSNLLPILPRFLQRKTAHDIFTRHSIVFSNIPGPANQFFYCKEPILGFQVIFPNLIPQALLVSYGGSIFFNMSIDTIAMPDAKVLLPQLFLEEIKDLASKYNIDSSDILSELSCGGILASCENRK